MRAALPDLCILQVIGNVCHVAKHLESQSGLLSVGRRVKVERGGGRVLLPGLRSVYTTVHLGGFGAKGEVGGFEVGCNTDFTRGAPWSNKDESFTFVFSQGNVTST